MALYESDVLSKFKNKYLTFISHLKKRKEEHLCYLKYPEATRKHIYTTNPVEPVHSSFEKMRIKKGARLLSLSAKVVFREAIFGISHIVNLYFVN